MLRRMSRKSETRCVMWLLTLQITWISRRLSWPETMSVKKAANGSLV